MKSLGEKKIAIIGLGYVGLPLAVEFGKNFSVIGFDINSKRITQLRAGFDVTKEVDEINISQATKLRFSDNIADLTQAEVFIVTVPTPIDKANRPDLTPLVKASETVGAVLKRGDIVVYESTVFPGCTEEICVPILEGVSGLKFNTDFYCGYSPERINPGDKENTLRRIKKVTSGSTPEVAEEIDLMYASIIDAGTHKASSIKVAEAAKVIENSQRDLNIAFVNELSIIFDRLGIDTLDVLEAAGSKWNFLPFRPGMVGGHCIGVDPYYLTHKAEELGYHPQVILAGRRINDNMARYAARKIIRDMIRNGHNVTTSRIGVLGVTFKENCPDTRNSKVVDLVREFESWNIPVSVCDPWADPDEVQSEYGLKLTSLDAINSLSALVVAVGHDEFRSLSPTQLLAMCTKSPKPVVGDLKSIYRKAELENAGATVFRL